MKTFLTLALALLLLLPLAACGPKRSAEEFYSMVNAPGSEHEGTVMLGMKRNEGITAYVRDDTGGRLRYDDNDILVSDTSKTHMTHPAGVTWDMSKEEIIAYYAKDPQVTLTEAPNLLTFTKTIGDTLYYARYVLYDDGTIFQVNLTTDPTVDPMEFPRSLN